MPIDVIEAEIPQLEISEQADEQSRDMTILRCMDQGSIATKTFEEHRPGKFREVREYQAGAVFEMLSTRLEGIDDLARKLTDLQAYRNCFVIRGKHIEGMTTASVRRTVRSRRDSKPFFEDAPKSWIMLDIDEYRPPLGMEWGAEPDGHKLMAYFMKQALPEPFKSARCFVQMSASCGLKTREIFKAHAWFFLDKALTSHQARLWIRSIGERRGKTNMYDLGDCTVDTSVFAPVQPHFTADPIIDGTDPFNDRGWLLPGSCMAVACEIPEVRMAQRSSKSTRKSEVNPSAATFKLKSALGEIGDQGRGFNEGIKYASMYAATILANRITSQEDLVSQISQSVYDADPGERSPEEIERYASADFINDKIDWWAEVLD